MDNPALQQEKAFRFALQSAYKALGTGQKRTARRWAEQAAALAPNREEPWLVLASVASPKASIHYLQEALRINPGSPRALKGMEWAVKRMHAAGIEYVSPTATQPMPALPALPPEPEPAAAEPEPAAVVPAPAPEPRPRIVRQAVRPEDHLKRRSVLLPWMAAAVFVCLVVAAWFGSPTLAQALAAPQTAAFSIANLFRPTATTLPTATALPTSTPTTAPTSTSIPTDTPEPTSTALPTETSTPEPTATPLPTDTPTPEPTNTPVPTAVPTDVPQVSFRPEGVGKHENWIDVDLTHQMLYAYTGDTLMGSFLVSTGTWEHPTVTGVYHIYVKYLYADMSGPGYYLANVPYVMYFYQGYGIHGTYWHNNFGTPMSHGCVNMTIDEAGWMYEFAVVGTVVNVHY